MGFDNLYVLFAFVGLAIVLAFLFGTRRMPYFAREALLTKGEMRFYTILQQAVAPATAIMMKVRMADIISCDDRAWRSGWGPRIAGKHIDFVLIDPVTTKIKLCIELDDATHRTDTNRIERDKFVNKAFAVANVPLLRVKVTSCYDISALRNDINTLSI